MLRRRPDRPASPTSSRSGPTTSPRRRSASPGTTSSRSSCRSTWSARSSTAARSRRSTSRASAGWSGSGPGSGREAHPGLKLGICGEHGGDPESIEFFHRAGLDYVSCSPVPGSDRADRGGPGGHRVPHRPLGLSARRLRTGGGAQRCNVTVRLTVAEPAGDDRRLRRHRDRHRRDAAARERAAATAGDSAIVSFAAPGLRRARVAVPSDRVVPAARGSSRAGGRSRHSASPSPSTGRRADSRQRAPAAGLRRPFSSPPPVKPRDGPSAAASACRSAAATSAPCRRRWRPGPQTRAGVGPERDRGRVVGGSRAARAASRRWRRRSGRSPSPIRTRRRRRARERASRGVLSPGSRFSLAVVVPAAISPIAPFVDGTKPPPGTYSVNHRFPLRSNASEVTSLEPDPWIWTACTFPAFVIDLIAEPPSANHSAPVGAHGHRHRLKLTAEASGAVVANAPARGIDAEQATRHRPAARSRQARGPDAAGAVGRDVGRRLVEPGVQLRGDAGGRDLVDRGADVREGPEAVAAGRRSSSDRRRRDCTRRAGPGIR